MCLLVRTLLDLLVLLALALVLAVVLTGGFELEFNELSISATGLDKPLVYFFVLLSVRYLFFEVPGNFSLTASNDWLRHHGVRGFIFLVLTVVVVKSFVSIIVLFYFNQALDGKDLIFTYAPDLALCLAISLSLFVITLSDNGKLNNSLVGRVRVLVYCFVGVGTVLVSIYYVLSGYVYFFWGSFLEPHHFQAMKMARVGDEFLDLFFRVQTLVAFCVMGVLYLFAKRIQKMISEPAKRVSWSMALVSLCLVPFALVAHQPVNRPADFSPSVASPLWLLQQPVAKNQNGVDDFDLIKDIDTSKFVAQKTGEIPLKYKSLKGAAKGKNLVFFVMESVRRRNLGLYGYSREPMPELTRLAENSLVFQNAYVMQPRSSKAMAALTLGIMPDPRLIPISWEPRRIDGHDTFFTRVLKQERRFYQGTAQPYGGDRLQDFFLAATHYVDQPVVSLETLQEDKSLSNDDRGLVQSFLRWVNESNQPFVGLLWTECAHMPYDAQVKPFGEKNLVDKYDNCLRQVDDALASLVEGLVSAGKLDDTLLVIFGDHGEALGENFDRGHGSYLYEHSMRIPFIIHNREIIKERTDVTGRFQLKDVPTTLLYLMGLPDDINQSVNIFSKSARDKLFMSNVYQDFKLGILFERTKFVYRPRYDLTYVYDLDADPQERINISSQFSKMQLAALKQDALTWYKFQKSYVDNNYPRR